MGRFWLLAVALNWGAWGEEFTKNQPYWKVPQAQTLRGHGSPYAKSAEVAEFPEGFLLKGLGVVQDKAGLHWARVEYAPGRTCFVRADSQAYPEQSSLLGSGRQWLRRSKWSDGSWISSRWTALPQEGRKLASVVHFTTGHNTQDDAGDARRSVRDR